MCLYKYLYNPDSPLNCIITTQKAVRFPGFLRRPPYGSHTFCQRMRVSSAHPRSWLDPRHRPAGSRIGAEPMQHPARADKPCGEAGYISSGLALNLCNHVAPGQTRSSRGVRLWAERARGHLQTGVKGYLLAFGSHVLMPGCKFPLYPDTLLLPGRGSDPKSAADCGRLPID